MSLDIDLIKMQRTPVYSDNITHNLCNMAKAAGLYDVLWRPDENDFYTAGRMIPILENGLVKLKADPDKFKKFNAENGWGCYEDLVGFVERLLEKCKQNPDAEIEVSR